MMPSKKLLFVHDHFFYENEIGQFYSAGGFPFYLWEKYLLHFNELLVVGRYGGKIANFEKLVLSSHPKVKFHFVDKFSYLKNIKNFRNV
jgi:hypothetical protein